MITQVTTFKCDFCANQVVLDAEPIMAGVVPDGWGHVNINCRGVAADYLICDRHQTDNLLVVLKQSLSDQASIGKFGGVLNLEIGKNV